MKIWTTIGMLPLLISCWSGSISYQYNGTTVTRVDNGGKILLYYGKSSEITRRTPYVKVTFRGIDGNMAAFLRFKTDGTVEVINYGGGSFTQSESPDRRIYIGDYENVPLDSLIKSYNGNFTNLIRVSDAINSAKELNLEYHKKVKAFYPKWPF